MIIHISLGLIIYIQYRSHQQDFYLVITEQHDTKSSHKELKKPKNTQIYTFCFPVLRMDCLWPLFSEEDLEKHSYSS